MEDATNLGREYYTEEPNHMLAAVAVMASQLYSAHDNRKAHEIAFLDGYRQARLRHEEYLREQSSGV